VSGSGDFHVMTSMGTYINASSTLTVGHPSRDAMLIATLPASEYAAR
jgi:hypothetical protein